MGCLQECMYSQCNLSELSQNDFKLNVKCEWKKPKLLSKALSLGLGPVDFSLGLGHSCLGYNHFSVLDMVASTTTLDCH